MRIQTRGEKNRVQANGGGLPDTALELRDGFGVALRDKQELLGLSPQVPA